MLILASSSPRRRELLSRLGVPFAVVPSGVEERLPRLGEDPAAYAAELARQKAAEVAQRYPGDVVLGADTVVAVGDHILGKPESEAAAEAMLALLRGRTHTVVSAVCVCCSADLSCGTVASRVTMRDFAPGEVAKYVRTGEPMDKAGAYAVQGLGGSLVSNVEGCYETVVGLPLCLTRDLLAGCGLRAGGRVPCRCGR